MKQTIYIRSLSNGMEEQLVLPMEKKALRKKLEHLGGEVIMTDWNGPYPISSEYECISQINEDVQMLSSCQNEYSITDVMLCILFKASLLGKNETLDQILTGSYRIINISAETESWSGTDEEKAAIFIYSEWQGIPALEEAFKHSAGVIPEEIVDYLDWNSIWNEYSLQGQWVLYRNYDNANYEVWAVHIDL